MPARRMPETVCPVCTSEVSCTARGKSARHARVQANRGRVSGRYAWSYGRRSGTFAWRYSRTGSPPGLSPEAALPSLRLGQSRKYIFAHTKQLLVVLRRGLQDWLRLEGSLAQYGRSGPPRPVDKNMCRDTRPIARTENIGWLVGGR